MQPKHLVFSQEIQRATQTDAGRLPLCFFCPVQVQELHPNAAAIEQLRRLPFLDDEATIAGLQAELPVYLAARDGCCELSDSENFSVGMVTLSSCPTGQL